MLVSVYLPTRNRCALLKRAVDSVLTQSWPDVELVVVNDASTDDTAVWLEQRARSEERLRVLHQPVAKGAPAARNLAIRAARGEWVTGLDDDDRFTPDRIELFVRFSQMLEQTGRTASCIYASETRITDQEAPRQRRGTTRHADLYEANWIGNQIFVRRDWLLELGGYDEAMPAWQDLELYFRLLAARGPAVLLDLPTYVFDDSERPDRISRQGKALLMDAWQSIVARHAADRPDRAQQLLLQIFDPSYGCRMGLGDLRRYFGLGLSGRAFYRLFRSTLRQWRGDNGAPSGVTNSTNGSGHPAPALASD